MSNPGDFRRAASWVPGSRRCDAGGLRSDPILAQPFLCVAALAHRCGCFMYLSQSTFGSGTRFALLARIHSPNA